MVDVSVETGTRSQDGNGMPKLPYFVVPHCTYMYMCKYVIYTQGVYIHTRCVH